MPTNTPPPLAVGEQFTAHRRSEVFAQMPIGTVIRGCNNRVEYTLREDGWHGRGMHYTSPDGYEFTGPYEVVSYPEATFTFTGVAASVTTATAWANMTASTDRVGRLFRDLTSGVSTERVRERPRDSRGRFTRVHTFRSGQYAMTSDRPRSRAGRDGSLADRPFRGVLVKLDRLTNGNPDSEGVWVVRLPDGMGAYIHESHLTYVDVDTVPFVGFFRGDVVQINDAPGSRPDGGGFVATWAAGAEGLLTSRADESMPGTWNVQVTGRGGQWIHENSMRVIERNGRRLVDGSETEIMEAPVRCSNRHYCNQIISDSNPTVAIQGRRDDGCARCTEACENCHRDFLRLDYALVDLDGQRFCSDCYRVCDDCSTYYNPGDYDECPNYEDHELPRGVHGYGHTSASMWLGGPLPKTPKGKHDGYYLGIELEISASYDQSAMPIYDWAEQHLGHRDAIVCKEDSSVAGFEIVTQPMTPAKFESVDWESFFDLINTNHPLGRRSDEPTEHGLHVHIGRVAFQHDDVATAAYCYLLAQGEHLERIGRRAAYHYCAKVQHPVSAAISQMGNRRTTVQTTKVARRGIYAGRDAINLQNRETIEIRAFRSTRSADYLRNAVRLTYLAADYVRYLRVNREAVSPKSLHWSAFARWVGQVHPEAFASIAGIESKASNRIESLDRTLVGAGINYDM